MPRARKIEPGKNVGQMPDRPQKLKDIFIKGLHFGAKKSKFTLKILYNMDQKNQNRNKKQLKIASNLPYNIGLKSRNLPREYTIILTQKLCHFEKVGPIGYFNEDSARYKGQ